MIEASQYPIRAAKYRHRVTLQQRNNVQDSTGAVTVDSWKDVVGMEKIPAEVAPLTGRELVAAQQIQSEVDTQITFRWRPGVTSSLRVLWISSAGRQVYSINAVIADPTNRKELTLLCTARAAEGYRSDGQ